MSRKTYIRIERCYQQKFKSITNLICFIFVACWGKTDLVFVLEDSCHVGKQNFQKMLDIVEDLVQEVPVGKGNVQVGVNTFRCTASTEFEIGKYKKGKDIIRAVNKIKYTGGKVNTGKAIEYTRKNSFPGI